MPRHDGMPLTVSEAQKRFAEIEQVLQVKPGRTPQLVDFQKAETLKTALRDDILDTVAIHSDQRTRGLMGVLAKLFKVQDESA